MPAKVRITWTRAVLLAALAWTVLLVLLSFVLPAVTVHSGQDGVQPRVPLVQYYGLAGLWPAAAFLLAVVMASALLRWGRTVPLSLWRLAALVTLVVVVLLACAAAAVLTHLVGLLTFPCGGLLCVALALAASRDAEGNDPAGTQTPTVSVHAR